MLVAHHIESAFDRDLAGIDAVVGAKGSPMQLILSGVLHLDVPPGNVPLSSIDALKNNPLVAEVIPVSLGDNLQGYRIVGTSLAYVDQYHAALAQGQLWDRPMQVVAGAAVARKLGLQIGQSFVGSHGLAAGGHAHGDSAYRVVGILQATGGVLDRLVLTDTASVWKVHEDYTAVDAQDRQVMEAEREVTMALVRYKSPLAAMSFPRWVNTSTEMQAASPALEVTRLLHMLGLGTDVLRAFASMLLFTAGLSVFIALWNAVRERRGDLALLRMLGAPAGFARRLAEIRRRGYSLRAGGGPWPHTGSVALPILSGGRLLGCINAIWMARAVPPEEGGAAVQIRRPKASPQIGARGMTRYASRSARVIRPGCGAAATASSTAAPTAPW
jgi:putative ABC transport system permease protein